MQKSTKYVTKPTQQQLFLYTKYYYNIMIDIILTRFPFKAVKYEVLGWYFMNFWVGMMCHWGLGTLSSYQN